jgi:pre-rRNA-processing protein TSR3
MFEYEIIVDHSETSKKCTILPLRYRDDFSIRRYKPKKVLPPLTADVLLHPDGISLDQLAKPDTTKIAALDCIWRRLEAIMKCMEGPLPTLVSIPPGFETAYPRKSKDGSDPSGGLATIEALFIAAAFLGHWDVSLLDKYYFGDAFLARNEAVFRGYGLA